MQIDNQIASHRWRLRHANSNHIPDGTPVTEPLGRYATATLAPSKGRLIR
jgi:hypothetical protein